MNRDMRKPWGENNPTWRRLRAGRTAHLERYGDEINQFRELLAETLDSEIDRLCERFATRGTMAEILRPIANHLKDYLLWLRWSPWLATQLTPPLGLVGRDDATRLSIATLTYLGARLVDDGIDNHLDYKGKAQTLLGRLSHDHPEMPPAEVRCQTALIGFWTLHYGLRRFASHGMHACAENVARLFEKIPPGAVAESFFQGQVPTQTYQEIVQRKSVAYDMILYQSLLQPLEKPWRSDVLKALAGASTLAQHLNDLMDVDDDAKRGQINFLLAEKRSQADFWADSLRRAESYVDAAAPCGTAVQGAIQSVMCEVLTASAYLWADNTREER